MGYAAGVSADGNPSHPRLIDFQVNKINRRKEFFRINLVEIKKVVEDMGLDATWTLAAAAAEYRESLAIEQALKTDPAFRERWVEEQESQADVDMDENEPYEAAGVVEGGGLQDP